MARTFKNHVWLTNPSTGRAEPFEPGDDEPSWAKDLENPIDPNNFVASDDVFNEDSGEFEKEKPNYSKLKKEELLELLKERSGDVSPGSKEDFVARLEASDVAHG